MSEIATFLTSFVQSLATMRLYSPGHPARSRAVEGAFAQLGRLLATDPHPRYSFLEQSVIYGDLPLHEMGQWPWAARLSRVGIQRMEFDASITREDFESFLDHVLNLLTTADEDSRLAGKRSTVKFGQVGVREGEEVVQVERISTLRVAYTLEEEVGVVQYLQQRAAERGRVEMAEVESVVRSLAVAMHQGGSLLPPLLELKSYDQYASIHSLNTAVLVMTLAESLGLQDHDIHQFGIAAVVHDIGMTLLPPGMGARNTLSPEERAVIERHPVEGARMLLASRDLPPLAATVAYEHHMRPDGNGYPQFHYPREPHYASRMVSVCSAYDALRMKRPFRPAWHLHRVLEYIYEGAGTVFDHDIAWQFVGMMQRLEGRIAAGA